MKGDGAARHASAAELKSQLEAERLGLPFLVFRDALDGQRVYTLEAAVDRLTIGRAADNNVPLEWDARVSRVHAELSRVGGDWIVEDDGLSRNGTWVNGERLVRRRRLQDGDVLLVGATHLRFRVPLPSALGTTEIDSSAPPEASLSPAQRRVLVALCRPLADGEPYTTPATNQQIADELVLSVEAVKTHLRTLFGKFGVEQLEQNRKRTTLAARALVSGSITVDELRER